MHVRFHMILHFLQSVSMCVCGYYASLCWASQAGWLPLCLNALVQRSSSTVNTVAWINTLPIYHTNTHTHAPYHHFHGQLPCADSAPVILNEQNKFRAMKCISPNEPGPLECWLDKRGNGSLSSRVVNIDYALLWLKFFRKRFKSLNLIIMFPND